ncbi:hypothetical protein Tco_0645474 [Tanacetum coccineum]
MYNSGCTAKGSLNDSKFNDPMPWIGIYVAAASIICGIAMAVDALNGEAILRTRLMPWSMRFCNGDSDYMWSTTLVLFSQTVVVGLGTISPAFRWFMTINFRCPTKARQTCGQEFVVERYWIKRMLLWQVQPLEIRICNGAENMLTGQSFKFSAWLLGHRKGWFAVAR